MADKKVFVFCIDGAPPELIFGEWLNDLPCLKKLIQQGTYAKLNTTVPPVSAVACISIYTGKHPKDHGVFEYTYRKNNSYSDIGVISADNVKEKSFWEISSDNNKKPITCLIPATWPIKPFNGIIVSGSLTPGIESKYTYPYELKEEIKTLFKEPFIIEIDHPRSLSKKELLEKVYKMTEMHFELMKYLIKNKEWDLFFGMIIGSDTLNHNFWKYFDKEHRRYEYNPEFEKALKDYYIFLDKRLSELIELLDKETKIIILSDHGMKRMDTRVNLSDWLIKEDYLVLKEPVNKECRLNMNSVDWGKTKVFAGGAWDGQIFINLKGREPEGLVEEKEYNNLIQELEEKLKKIPGDDGKKLNTKVFIKKRDYNGKAVENAPDMIVYFDDLQYGCNTSLIGNKTLWSPKTAMGGDDVTHSQQGIFISNDSKKGYIGEIDIIDIAPTILNKLNVPIPKDMEGKIID